MNNENKKTFEEIYKDIINTPLLHHFNEYFDIEFFVFKNQESKKIKISDKEIKNSQKIHVKCRKLSIDNWDRFNEQQDLMNREKLLLMFSVVETNFMEINFDMYGFMTIQALNNLLTIHVSIVKQIVKKINKFYNQGKDPQHRKKLTAQFKRLYTSDKAIKLNYTEISDFLHYCNFWEKLGLNYFQVKQLPYDVYQSFLTLMSIEIQVKNAQMKKLTEKNRRRR